ncbi:MAG: hypothetical protein QOJ09_3160 [Actinomycetota bacterium]|nr:hypothetical protein [Actinomycetota bacterium]
MALRDKLAERSRPYLEDGEQIEQAFLAQTGPTPWLMALIGALAMMLAVKRRIIVVTDRAIVVLAAGAWTGTNPKSLVTRLPRQTRLGPLSGLWGRIELGGQKMWVHKRFHKDVEAADAKVSAPPT